MKAWVVALLITLVALIFGAAVGVIWGMSTVKDIEEKEEKLLSSFLDLANAYEMRLALISDLIYKLEDDKEFTDKYGSYLERLKEAHQQISDFRAEKSTLDKPASFSEFIKRQEKYENIYSAVLRRALRFEQYAYNNDFSAYRMNVDKLERNIKKEIKKFNNAVLEYNMLVERFPSNMVAVIKGKFEKPFHIDEG